MKNIILIYLLVIPLSSLCNDTLYKEYSEVIPLDNTKADELNFRAKRHISKIFISANDVIQMDVSNSILVKGKIKVTVKALGVSSDYYVRFNYTIDCKDNKYRYNISDYILEVKTTFGNKIKDCPLNEPKDNWLTNKQWAEVKNQTASAFNQIISDLKKEMSSQDNW